VKPLAVVASGLVTGVGMDAASSCAAIRCGLSASAETAFINRAGEPQIGCAVVLDEPMRGISKQVAMAVLAIRECLAPALPAKPPEIPLVLCLPEKERPGRLPDLEEELFPAVQEALKIRFHPDSILISAGRVGIGRGLKAAERLVHEKGAPCCIVAGVDSMLVAETINSFDADHRILTPKNSDGFIPGEAASAVLLSAPSRGPELLCLGVGLATEPATIGSETPLRADGLVEAYRAAFSNAGRSFDDVDFRIADVTGEQYGLKEAQLAIGRAMRKVKERFDLWHPTDCIGEVGAAIGPCILAVALAAARRGYAPGPGALCHFGSDDGQRAAVVLRVEKGRG
jgi:3-oxoacyl-[acyl-carrier-protein] synthase-1